MNRYLGQVSMGTWLHHVMSLWKLPILAGTIVVSLIIGAGVSLGDEDGRTMAGEELKELLPGKTLTGWNQNGEWIWELHANGKGYQIWDDGSRHKMKWEIIDKKICVVFSDGRHAGKERCHKVIDYGNGRYARKRKGKLSKFSLK